MGAILPDRLADRLEAGDVFVLDLRPAEEFEAYHIDGSYNAPVYHELRADGDALEPYLEDLPADTDIVTVCRVGSCARDATTALENRGYHSVTLEGGIRNWRGYEENSLTYRLRTALRSLLS